MTETACESYEWHGTTYTTTGTYTYAYSNADGCASVDTLKLTVHYGTHNVVTETACESYTWHGTTYTQSGTYTFAYTNTDGCASVDTLKLTINPSKTTALTAGICLGETYNENGFDITPTAAGTTTHTLNLQTIHGCDSTVMLTLTTYPNPVVSVNSVADVCPNVGSVELTATVTSATSADYTYEWSGDLTATPATSTTSERSSKTFAMIPAAPNSCGRTYSEVVKVTDGHGCTAMDVATVSVKMPTTPTISTTAIDGDKGCNPTITTPTFTVSDNCAGVFTLPSDSIIDGGVVNTSACGRSRTWTAHYTDPCGNPATDVSVTYTWTEDAKAPVIHTEAVSDHKGCNPTIVAPTFTVTDNCEGAFILPTEYVTTTGKTGDGCEKSQSWTANYTDGCDNPAEALTVTYYWTESEQPVITTDLTDQTLGCDATVAPPTPADFTVIDDCNSSATATVTASAETVTDYSHSITYTATYTNDCNISAEPVQITYTWTESPEVSISCPEDVTKTLAYGDCVMEIYPEEIGTPIINAPADWPMTVSNDIPVDNLYQEGETVITWTATDQVCGYSVSCQQKVIVVFPQCPDAVDCEGNVYHGVRIDCDCWTQTNLISNCYGDAHECELTGVCENPIPCVYEYVSVNYPNADENVAIFGKLYCAEAGVGDSTVNEHGHIRGICPEGWYLPTPEKYEELNLHGAEALKSPLYWTDGGGDNITGFTWLPAGWWNGALQRFEGLMSENYFLSTEVVDGQVRTYVYEVHHDCDSLIKKETHSGYGYSVRCVKEKE